MSSSIVEGANINFTNALDAAELQLEAIKALGHYKLAIAQAELVRAHALNEANKAAARQVVVKQLNQALAQLKTQKAQIGKQIRSWARLGQRMSLIQEGDAISRVGLTQMWQAYRVYQRMATSEVNHAIEAATIGPEERKRQLYAVIKTSGPEALSADVPDDVENLAALIGWLERKKNVIPKRGRRTFQLVRDAFLQLAADTARTEITSLRGLMESIEKGTLAAWRPIMLAPFLDNSAITKLLDVKPSDS
jgi:hypothetical protein